MAEGSWRSVGETRPGAQAGLQETDPDEALLARVAEGDPAAVRALVARKLPRLMSLAQRMLGEASEAEDVAQEAFLRVWKQAPRWPVWLSPAALGAGLAAACAAGVLVGVEVSHRTSEAGATASTNIMSAAASPLDPEEGA